MRPGWLRRAAAGAGVAPDPARAGVSWELPTALLDSVGTRLPSRPSSRNIRSVGPAVFLCALPSAGGVPVGGGKPCGVFPLNSRGKQKPEQPRGKQRVSGSPIARGSWPISPAGGRTSPPAHAAPGSASPERSCLSWLSPRVFALGPEPHPPPLPQPAEPRMGS